jgi:DNA-binding beta-propeller fold protein YncE
MFRAIASSWLTALVLIGAGAALAQPASRFALSWGAAGRAAGALNGPDNLAVDLRGDVYVADRDNNRIEKFTSSGRYLAAFGRNGGDGTAGLGPGEFNHPRGVTTDGLGDLFVADSASNRIEKFGPDGRFQARFGRNGGDGSAGRARGEFNDPRGLATDPAGNLYVADHGNNRVQKLDSDGRFLAVWGRNGGEGSSGRGAAQFTRPRGVAVDSTGHLFVADKNNNRVQEFGPDGQFMRMWGRNGGDGSAGLGNGEFNTPYSIAVDRSGQVYVADTANNRIQAFTGDGGFLARLGRNGGDGTAGSGAGEFHGPYGVATDCRGNLYVSDEGNNRIEKFGSPGGPAAICPPALKLAALPHRIPGRVFAFRVACDEPCTVTAAAQIALNGHVFGTFHTVQRQLGAGRAATFKLRLPARTARSMHRSLRANRRPVVRLGVSASGFAGQSALQRNRQIRR